MTPMLSSFPVDDETLDLVQLAIDTPDVSVAGAIAGLGDVTEDDGPSYHWTDALAALIDEIRRLRAAPDTEGAAQ